MVAIILYYTLYSIDIIYCDLDLILISQNYGYNEFNSLKYSIPLCMHKYQRHHVKLHSSTVHGYTQCGSSLDE